MSYCSQQVTFELELALDERGLGIPFAGDDLCEVLVRPYDGEACIGSGVLAVAELVIDTDIILNVNIEPESTAVGIVGSYLGVSIGVELSGFLLRELGQNVCAQFLEPFLVKSFCHDYSS